MGTEPARRSVGPGAPDPVGIVGVGIDAVEIARIREAVERTPGLVGRLFTVTEQTACTDPRGNLRHDGLAARFAAKEAVAKALGTGVRGFGFRDVEIVGDDLGKPHVVLHAGAGAVAAGLGVARVHVSLSTSRDLAVANAVAEGEPA